MLIKVSRLFFQIISSKQEVNLCLFYQTRR